jgi:hypothetical protein
MVSTLDDALQTIERVVGYPLLGRKALRDVLVERAASYAPARVFEDVIDQNVHWKGERLPGDYHEDPEFYYQYVKIEQTPDILARHFAGMFAFATGASGRKSDNRLVADLNPRRDGLDCPVYRHMMGPSGAPLRGQITQWYVFPSPAESSDFRTRVYAVSVAFEEEPEKLAGLGADLAARHPRAVRAYAELLRQYEVELPPGPASFPDPDGERLLAAHDALLPVAEVLVARSKGAKAQLAAADAARGAAQAGVRSGYPPAILLALLVPALSGRADEAKGVARTIMDEGLGVPLTRTWAAKVLADEPPFEG